MTFAVLASCNAQTSKAKQSTILTDPNKIQDSIKESLHSKMGQIQYNGQPGSVVCMTVYKSCLIIGGQFSNVGVMNSNTGVKANGVAMWNTDKWTNIGYNLPYTPVALAATDNALFAEDSRPDSTIPRVVEMPTSRIYQLVGDKWQEIYRGAQAGSPLFAYNNNLYAVSYISTTEHSQVEFVIRWNGTKWDTIGCLDVSDASFVPAIKSMIGYAGHLLIGGKFDNLLPVDYATNTSTIPVDDIAIWNGAKWSSAGFSLPQDISVSSLTIWNNKIFASDKYDFWVYNGQGWIKGPQPNGRPLFQRLVTCDNNLYAQVVSGQPATAYFLLKWTGQGWGQQNSNWDQSGQTINAIQDYNGRLYTFSYKLDFIDK